MPKRSLLVVNPRSGAGGDLPALLRAAAAAGVDSHVLGPGEEAANVARAADASVLGVASGDGTLGAVAGVALERGVPLVCVPFGTRNHFARDLGLDVEDPVGCVAAFADGVERVVDVGRAGDRVFVNNVSIGAYADYVHGLRLRGLRARRLLIDGAPVEARVLLVANNAYSVLGRREALDEGRLYLYVAHGLRLSWEERSAARFVVAGHGPLLAVAVDGDPVRVSSPLEVSVEPRALTVLVPRERD